MNKSTEIGNWIHRIVWGNTICFKGVVCISSSQGVSFQSMPETFLLYSRKLLETETGVIFFIPRENVKSWSLANLLPETQAPTYNRSLFMYYLLSGKETGEKKSGLYLRADTRPSMWYNPVIHLPYVAREPGPMVASPAFADDSNKFLEGLFNSPTDALLMLHTLSSARIPEWWRVDFGSQQFITSATILNSNNCCPNRPDHFQIWIGNSSNYNNANNINCFTAITVATEHDALGFGHMVIIGID